MPKKHIRYPSEFPEEIPTQEEVTRRKLVRRSHFVVIIAAWVITVPAAALLAALIYSGLALMR